MHRFLRAVVLVVLGGCGRHEPPSGPPAVEVTPAAGDEAASETRAPPASEPSADAAPVIADPQALYEACRERVEGPEKAGECETDADCVAVGCSHEMCVAAASARGLASGCEIQPCFQVLESCGCQEGVCRWTVSESAGAPARPFGRKLPLPAELQSEQSANPPAESTAP